MSRLAHPSPYQVLSNPLVRHENISALSSYPWFLGAELYKQYTINRSKILMGFVGSDWEQRIIAYSNSALEEWKEATPAHRELSLLHF
jgi:hypothetical protein